MCGREEILCRLLSEKIFGYCSFVQLQTYDVGLCLLKDSLKGEFNTFGHLLVPALLSRPPDKYC
jgi:hypothetical protein